MAKRLSTETSPRYHVTLTDGKDEVGMVICDGRGRPNPLAFQARPYPRQALKTVQGQGSYSDLEPPYFDIAQDDFTGGRGSDDFDKNKARYYESSGVIVTRDAVQLGPLAQYAKKYRSDVDEPKILSASYTWQAVRGPTRYFGQRFQATASYTCKYVELIARKKGAPTDNLIVYIYSDSTGSPGSSLGISGIAPASFDFYSQHKRFDFNVALTSGTYYWIIVDGGDDTHTSPDNCYELAVGPFDSGKKSTSLAGPWTAADYDLWFRASGADANERYIFFEYKRALYAVSIPYDGSNSDLFINGDCGAADSNSGDKSKLNDATKAWAVNEFAGAVVIVTNGPGSEESRPWRTINSNTATALTVLDNWIVAHTTATEYVIVKSDKWTLLSSLGGFVTDVAVAGEFFYVAFGDSAYLVRRYQAYNNAGVWTLRNQADVAYATVLKAIPHPDGTMVLWGGTSGDPTYDVCAWKGIVPPKWGALYTEIGTLAETNNPWDSRKIDNVSQSKYRDATRVEIYAGFTTGIVAVENLPTPVDITKGSRIGNLSRASVALDSGDMLLRYDDVANLGTTWQPSALKFYYNRPTRVRSDASRHYDGASYLGGDKMSNGEIVDDYKLSLNTNHWLYAGHSEVFSDIAVYMGTTKNAVATSLEAQYYDGSTWVNVAIDDGTVVGGATLAQSGGIAWIIPAEWAKRTIDANTLYWMRFRPYANLTANIDVQEIQCRISSEYRYKDLEAARNGWTGGSSRYLWKDKDYEENILYVGCAEKFNKIIFDMLNGNTTIASVLLGEYFNGTGWSAIPDLVDGTAVGGKTMYQDGAVLFTLPNDWQTTTVNGVTTYWVRFRIDATTSPYAISVSWQQISVHRESYKVYNFPAMIAGEWQWVTFPISPLTYPTPDESAIKSIGLNIVNDKGAMNFSMHGGWKILRDTVTYFDLPNDARITGIEAYSSNQDLPVQNPWVFTENYVYEIQTQNDDAVVPMPLREMEQVRSATNGIGHCVNGPYLYFNLHRKLERYYNRVVDDIGPDRERAWINTRRGVPGSLASYPGRVFVAYNAQAATSRSSIMMWDGSAWQDYWLAYWNGQHIRHIYIQDLPDTEAGRMWVSASTDILYLPVSATPDTDSGFVFNHDGYLTTAWMYAELHAVEKLWRSLTVFWLGNNTYTAVGADYQLELEENPWVKIGTFAKGTKASREFMLAKVLPRGKRIRFRLRLVTTLATNYTPSIKAITVEGATFIPVKYEWSFSALLTERDLDIDLEGDEDSTWASVEAKWSKLLKWAKEGTILKMNLIYSPWDDETVFLNAPVAVPYANVPDDQTEAHVLQLSVFEA